MKAILRQTRISSKKANLIAQLVRGKMVEEAMGILKFTPKKAAPLLYKLIASAAANAEENFKQEKSTLKIKEIIVTEGPTYKRRNLISRGRSHPILKRTAHITVKLESVQTPKKKEVSTKKETDSKKVEVKKSDK